MPSRGVRSENDINRRIIRNQIEDDRAFVQSLKVFGNLRNAGGSGGGSSRNSGLVPLPGKITDLGTLTDPFVIDFAIHDARNLVGNIDKNTTITFANIPPTLRLHLKLYILSMDPTIIIGGINIKTAFPALHPLAVGDFLDFDLESDDQTNVTISVLKKNNEIAGRGAAAPSVPENVESFDHQKNSIGLKWKVPATGNLPITYELAYSLSPGGTPENGPTTPEVNPPAETSDLQATFTGLAVATTYYLWVRAKNAVGNSNYFGPLQTITEPSDTAGDVSFSIAAKAGTFDTIAAQWTQPSGKNLSFDLLRKLPAEATYRPIVDDDNPAPIVQTVFDDSGLKQNTAYDYRFIVYNESGSILATIDTTVTTNQIDAPVVVLTNQGARLKFTVTLPDGISLGEVEWSLSNTVDANGNFTDRPVTEDVKRPIGITGDVDVDVITQVLNKNTLYYGHARLIVDAVNGPFSATDSATMGNVLAPSQPSITKFNALGSNQARIQIRFTNGTSRGEQVQLSYRPGGTIDEYADLEAWDRDRPPLDDEDTREDRIEAIRTIPLTGSVTLRAQCTNQSGSSTADTDNETIT